MNILCVEQDRTKLRQLKRDARAFVPRAHITVCRDPCKAEAVAKAKGCDVLLTDSVFDGFRLDGTMLAELIQRVNPRVNIIFVTVCGEWEHAEAIFRLRVSGYVRKPYEPSQLAEEFANLRYAL